MKISIAMATFNGERFILEQLKSLAAQTLLPFELVVTDDGSNDGTMSIVREFSESAPFPVYVHRNASTLGYAENFLKAASLCRGEWVAFCDQDDVWLETKLSTVSEIANKNARVALISHAAEIVDERLHPLGSTFGGLKRPILWNPGDAPLHFYRSGFTCVFKRALLNTPLTKARPPDWNASAEEFGRAVAHDQWVCMLAAASGAIYLAPEVLALYRRHHRTVTSFSKSKQGSVKKKLATLFQSDSGYNERQAQAACDCSRLYADWSAENRHLATSHGALRLSKRYASLARALRKRREIYIPGTGAWRRLRAFLKLFAIGAYWMPGQSVLRWRCLPKDFAAVLFIRGDARQMHPGGRVT